MCNELVKRILYALVIFIAPYRNLFVFSMIKFMSSFRPGRVYSNSISAKCPPVDQILQHYEAFVSNQLV